MKQVVSITCLSIFMCSVANIHGMAQHKVAAEKAQQDNLSSQALMEAVTAFAQTHTEEEANAYHDMLHTSAASNSSSLANSYLIVPLPADEEENAAQVTPPASMVQSNWFSNQLLLEPRDSNEYLLHAARLFSQDHTRDPIVIALEPDLSGEKTDSSEASSLYDDAEDADVVEENKRLSSDFSSPHAADTPAIPQGNVIEVTPEMVHFDINFINRLYVKILDAAGLGSYIENAHQAGVYEKTLQEFAQKVFVAVTTYKTQHQALGILKFFPKLHSAAVANRLIDIRKDLSVSIKDAVAAMIAEDSGNNSLDSLLALVHASLNQNLTGVIDIALEVGYQPSFMSDLKARVSALSGLTKTVVLTAIVAVVGFAGKETVKRLLRRA